MAVNFNQLAPIAAPQAIANVPTTANQPSPLASLGAGLQAAVQNSQNSELNAQTKQLNDQKLKAGNIELEEKQAERRDASTLRQAAQSGFENYIQAYMKIDPAKALGVVKQQADIKKTITETVGLEQDANKKGISNANQIMIHLGDLAQSTESLKDPNGQPMTPEQKAAYFNKGLEFFPDSIKNIAGKVAPNGYDDGVGVNLMTLGAMAKANIMEKSKGTPSDKMKNASRIAELTTAVKSGAASDQNKIELESLKQQTQQPKLVNNPTDMAIAQADTQTLKDISTRSTTYDQTNMAISGAKQALEKTPAILLGPVSGLVNAAKYNKDGQELISNLNRLTLLAKGQFNMGSQGFTDADREFVKAINGDVTNFKGSLKTLLDQSQSFTEHAKQQDWLKSYNINKKGSDGGEAFLKDNPEPLVKVKLPDGKTGQVPIRQLDSFIKDTKGSVL